LSRSCKTVKEPCLEEENPLQCRRSWQEKTTCSPGEHRDSLIAPFSSYSPLHHRRRGSHTCSSSSIVASTQSDFIRSSFAKPFLPSLTRPSSHLCHCLLNQEETVSTDEKQPRSPGTLLELTRRQTFRSTPKPAEGRDEGYSVTDARRRVWYRRSYPSRERRARTCISGRKDEEEREEKSSTRGDR
jgi:hypothetical protein